MLKQLCTNLDGLDTRKRLLVFFGLYLAVFVLAFLFEGLEYLVLGKSDAFLVAALLSTALLFVVGTYIFINVSSWAATIAPKAGFSALKKGELRARLLAFNDQDLPFQIKENKHGNLVAEWKIVDAKWASLFEAAGLEMQHEIILDLDDGNKRVKAVDIDKEISWSAGHASFKGRMSFFRGITFFHYDRACEIGLIYKDGHIRVQPAYNYRFNLAEMKNPIIDCITESGWTFFPVMFISGPFATKW